jgi:hypothetical protein
MKRNLDRVHLALARHGERDSRRIESLPVPRPALRAHAIGSAKWRWGTRGWGDEQIGDAVGFYNATGEVVTTAGGTGGHGGAIRRG